MESYQAGKRIGVLGGSFDPVHIGHLIIAQDAAERFELSEVLLIPAFIPPHKQHLRQVDSKHRINMLERAVETDPRFSISDIELNRGGVSYTVDTMRALRELYADAELFLIIGSDTLVDLHSWHKLDELLKMCKIATFLRPGEELVEIISDKIRVPEQMKSGLLENIIGAHRIEISSTEIRRRVADGLGIRYLVPKEVEAYIYEHGLYRGEHGPRSGRY